MSEDFDKSEEASPYKLEKARQKGQVGKSQELVNFAAQAGFWAVLAASIGQLCQVFISHTSWWLSQSHLVVNESAYLATRAEQLALDLVYALMPMFVAAAILAIATSIAHAGVVFSFEPIKPKFSKINPAAGLKKLFSRKTLIEFAKTLVKLFAYSLVLYLLTKKLLAELPHAGQLTPFLFGTLWWHYLKIVVASLLAIGALTAVLDVLISKRQFARDMRMSKRDLKDEHKNREGDPHIKNKRKRNQADMLKKIMATSNVSQADVIITNPTHVAVALQFRPNRMAVPIVLASGRGVFAQFIMSIARRNRVPIFRKPVLARALYKRSKLGMPIDADLELPVAEAYRWVSAMPNNRIWSESPGTVAR